MEKNNLEGPVPAEIQNLENLSVVVLAENDLSGVIPEAVCESGNLNVLTADCHKVECECCTECGPTEFPTSAPTTDTEEPSPLPTPEPTEEPTDRPTEAPTPCRDAFVEFDTEECTDTESGISVRFRNCEPENGDWVGIFDKDADPRALPSPILWAWTCGTQSCRGSPISNTVFLDENNQDIDGGFWPLDKGDYHAYLIRNSGAPFTAFAESDKLKLKDNDC